MIPTEVFGTFLDLTRFWSETFVNFDQILSCVLLLS